VQKPSIFQDNQNQLIENQLKIHAALEFLHSLTLSPIVKLNRNKRK
jgi:hypothetical protein